MTKTLTIFLINFTLFIYSTYNQSTNPAEFYSNDRSISYLTNTLTHSPIFTKVPIHWFRLNASTNPHIPTSS